MQCVYCATQVLPARAALNYETCLPCGEKQAKKVKHCIVPMHKSNYIVVSDITLLAQLTRPGRGDNF
jgi:hypothetical protein